MNTPRPWVRDRDAFDNVPGPTSSSLRLPLQIVPGQYGTKIYDAERVLVAVFCDVRDHEVHAREAVHALELRQGQAA